jgi:hypothetical protein
MPVTLNETEREVISCRGCKVFRPRKLGRLLNRSPGWDPIVWHIINGKKVIACATHEARLIERGGWNGTGKRQ